MPQLNPRVIKGAGDHVGGSLDGQLIRLALVAWLALSASGCGLVFVEGPPSNHPSLDYFTCTESKVLPTIDAIGFGLNVWGLGQYFADPDAYPNVTSDAVIASVGWSVALALGWVLGEKKVDKCREARLEFAERSREAAERLSNPPTVVPER